MAANNNDPAFEFSPDLGGGNSIYSDEIGRLLLIRTGATAFGHSTVTISSTGTAYVSSYAPLAAAGAAVPEPSTYVLAALGLAGLGVVTRRKRISFQRCA